MCIRDRVTGIQLAHHPRIATALVGEHQDALALAERRLHRVGQPRPQLGLEDQPVHHHLDAVLRLLVEGDGLLDKKAKHSIEVVVDRLVLKPELRSRLTDSVETALREGKGVLMLTDESGGNPRVMSELNACHPVSYTHLTLPTSDLV